jgi:hypothetical protein
VAIPGMDDAQGWLDYLKPVLLKQRNELKPLNDEYELQAQRLYMHPDLLAELGDRIQQVVIAWPQLVVDAVEERLDPLGFRLPKGEPDDDLARVWQANNLDEETQLGRLDALVMKRSYLCVGSRDDDRDTPLVTVESPLEVFADIDPRDRSVRGAIRWYDEPSTDTRDREQFATVLLKNKTAWFGMEDGRWQQIDEDVHNLDRVPVVPLVNRSRIADRYGKSEIAPVLPLTRAANKLATDMMVGAEFLALPLRGIFGIGPEDLEDAQGNKLTALQAILGRLLTLKDDNGMAKMFEFKSADLANFHSSINALAALVASISGLPPDYLGLKTENPPSAESRLAGEIRLIKRAERKQVPFGGAYESTMRLVKRFQEGDWDPQYSRLETIWRNPATPTRAQTADASTKLRAERIISNRQAQEDNGYTEAQIARMDEELEAEAQRDPIRQAVKQMSGGPADGGA